MNLHVREHVPGTCTAYSIHPLTHKSQLLGFRRRPTTTLPPIPSSIASVEPRLIRAVINLCSSQCTTQHATCSPASRAQLCNVTVVVHLNNFPSQLTDQPCNRLAGYPVPLNRNLAHNSLTFLLLQLTPASLNT